MNILLIDDDPVWLIKLDLMLEEIGYKALKCANLTDAGKIIDTNPIELIISDVILNDELIFQIKPILISKKIPCIFITAAPIHNNYLQAKSISNSRFLVKPFHLLTLRDAIASLTNNSHNATKEHGVVVSGKFKHKMLIKYEDILWLDAERNYTTIHALNQKKYTIKKALKQIATELDKRFLQVHRSVIVNADYITRINFMQDKIVINGNILKIGRSFKAAIATFLNNRN